MEYRLVKEDEIKQVIKLSAQAFSYSIDECFIQTEYKKKLKSQLEQWVAVNDEGTVVAGVPVHPFRVYFNGHKVKCGGIGGVVSAPEHRRRGNVKMLFRTSLKAMYDRGYFFSYLYPFSYSYYRKFGYETACNTFKATFVTDNLLRYDMEGYTKKYSKDEDLDIIKGIYHEYSKDMNGMLCRDDELWKNRLDIDNYKDRSHTYIWYDTNDRALGYVSYSVVDDPVEFYKKNMMITDIAFINDKGLYGIFSILGKFSSNLLNTTLQLSPKIDMDLLAEELYDIKIVPHNLGMNRVVNAKKALELMKYPDDSGSFIIDIKDEFCDWNNKTYKVEYIEGNPNVTETNQTSDVTMSVHVLSQILTGYKSYSNIKSRPDVRVTKDNINLHKVFVKKDVFLADRF